MGLFDNLGAYIDSRKRVAARNADDLIGSPRAVLDMWASQVKQDLTDQMRAMGNAVSGSVMPGVRQGLLQEGMNAAMPAVGLLGAIKAYHGSPHKFDKFDMSKIGTGEGAQAYGHGLYFAENPAVANDYAWNLSQQLPDRIKYDGKPLQANTMLARAVEDVGLIGKEGALQKIDDSIRFNEKYAPDMAGMYRSIKDVVKGMDPAKVSVNKGNQYEVSLRWPDAAREAADPLGPQHFLDWDKPLSQQAPAIRDAVRKLPKGYVNGAMGERRFLDPAASTRTGAGLLQDISMMRRGTPEDMLREAGIPGIRYLDAGSRGAGEGTANYVVFDDKIPQILKRNGLLP